MSKRIQPGSKFLLTLIRTLSLLLGASALTLLALSIWLWTQFNSFSIIELVFIGLGIYQLLLVLILITAKTSYIRLRCFFIGAFLLLISQITLASVVFATGQSIIEDITKDSKTIEKLKDHLDIVTYFTLACIGILILLLMFVYCYIGSLKNRNFQYDYKFTDNQGNLLSHQEKTKRDTENVQQKYNKKRQQLENKYSNYKAYKQRQ